MDDPLTANTAPVSRLMLRPSEVAEQLGVSTRHVYRLMDEFGLPYVEVGKPGVRSVSRRVPVAALMDWVAGSTRSSADPHPGQPHDPIPEAYVVGTRAYVAKVCRLCRVMLDDGRGKT